MKRKYEVQSATSVHLDTLFGIFKYNVNSILPIFNLFSAFEQLSWILISVIWIRRHSLNHPVSKLGHQLEIRALDVGELGDRLGLLVVV